MNTLLPTFGSDQEYDRFDHAEELYLPAMQEICDRHTLSYKELRKFGEGESAIVFFLDDALVIKLCPPLWSQQVFLETTVLEHVEGRLLTPTPHVLHIGELEDWAYFVMTHLRGRRLNAVFPSLSQDDRLTIYRQMGITIRELHSLPKIKADLPVPDWHKFVHVQREHCQDHHRGRGVSESLIEQIPSFLSAHLPPGSTGPSETLLHTELTRDGWFIQQESGSWAVSGIFDFGDVMVGDPDADSLWGEVDQSLLRSYYAGYGYSGGYLSEELACLRLAYVMLHRYATLSWMYKQTPELRQAKTLETLSLMCFPTAKR
jgi:hygromycin-B 7''-O-kinase